MTVLDDDDEVVDDRCRPGVAGGGVCDGCDRFTRFAGGCCASVGREDLGGEGR